MIADMINNKKLNSIVTELFIRGGKLNIPIVFITQSYFKVPKDILKVVPHFFILKTLNKRELWQNALNHSSDTVEPYYFLVNDTTIPSDNPLRFRENLLE